MRTNVYDKVDKSTRRKYQKRTEMAKAHQYTTVKVARDEDLMEQIGRDMSFDLVDHNKVRSFRIERQMHFNLFKEEVAKEFGIPVQFQRFWLWTKRLNKTYRPTRHLTPQEEAQPVNAFDFSSFLVLFISSLVFILIF
ncbi:ubiquitin C-terminal hydrolase 12-like isoform X2 [Rhododendron vialii]|uniref:ubiquitin C-terminal hydrolase 12-like isoform X2 n=1 Tax=Rhododendron vialii TaxID=182163 RepID=UPI00265E22A5|nr:ubiquitin C-terminal hydrolase 12-like isoform X2 [Rhododendron vialii]